MYAIVDSKNSWEQVAPVAKTRSEAWDEYFMLTLGHNGRGCDRDNLRNEANRRGLFCWWRSVDEFKPKKSKPKKAGKSEISIQRSIVIENTVDLDFGLAKALYKFFIAKQSAGEIEYTYEYHTYDSDKDAKKFYEHLIEFFNDYRK